MNHSRVVKRKVNGSGTKIEPPKKALKKTELLEQFNTLQEEFTKIKEENRILLENQRRFDIIEAENRLLIENQNKHVEAIHLLEETITVLQNNENDTEKEQKKTIDNLEEMIKELRSKFANRSVYICGECEYLADCVHDFNDHTHSQDEIEENSQFNCRFCEETFGSLGEVMQHNKVNHTSNVQDCTNYLENSCWYGDNCWFLHRETLKNTEPSFKCKFCEHKFKNRNLLSDHMKMLHIQFVSKCKNEGDCNFYSRKCWFVHEEDIENAYLNAKNGSQNQNIIHDME